jgi:hypothetical protein
MPLGQGYEGRKKSQHNKLLIVLFFFFYSSGTHRPCVQALLTELGCYFRDGSTSLFRQLLLSGPVTRSATSTHSFLSYRPPHCSAQTLADSWAREIAPLLLTKVAVTVTSSSIVPSGTQGLQTPEPHLEGWKMGEEFVRHPGLNP